MKSRLNKAVLTCAGMLGIGVSVMALAKPPGRAHGGPASMPATAPLTWSGASDADDLVVGGLRPTSEPVAINKKKYPTPAELWEKMNAKKEATAKLANVAYFNLDQPVTEQPAAFSLFGDNAPTVHDLIDRLHKVRSDANLRGVLITFGSTSLNLAQAQEIRSALDELRKVGKRTFVYADNFNTDTYAAASGATDICMLEGGEIMMPGVGLETMFYKGLFDKFGVQADYVQIGEYKGAEEPYTRTGPSPELRHELNKLTEGLYEQLVDGIASHRNVSREIVKQAIDDAIISAKSAKELKLVDHLVDIDGLRSLLKDELKQDVNLEAEYATTPRERPDFSSPFALFSFFTHKQAEESNRPAIALIHAEGMIVDGSAQGGLFGGSDQVGGDDMRQAFRIASRDPNIKAIVLRIDSPGGSALASEVMWQAARHAAAEKPLIISIGSMAASGGYYLASSGDYIFADPSAIVGSIGVVGGKFVVKDLFEKLGLGTESFTRGENADLFSMNQPFTDKQRKMVTAWMTDTYKQFTERVMTTRRGKIADIDKVARGRIFVAQEAKALGMVDELGGVEDAIAFAARRRHLAAGAYDVHLVPAPKTLADLLSGGGEGMSQSKLGIEPKITIAPDSVLAAMPPAIRKLFGEQLLMIRMLQTRPVMLVSPYVLTIK